MYTHGFSGFRGGCFGMMHQLVTVRKPQPRQVGQVRFVGHWCGLLCGLVMLSFQTGCQTIPGRDVSWGSPKEMWGSVGQKKEEKIVYEEPRQLAVIWTDSTMVGGDSLPVRGFAGRVYFNDPKNKPVRVEGEFIVYAYDDSSTPNKTTADRVYKFREEELQSHYSPSGIGPSYSFWIPWDAVGGERKSIALVPVFKAKSGKVVSGDQSLNILPGKATANEEKAKRVPYYVAGSSPAVINSEHVLGASTQQMPKGEASGLQQVAHFEPAGSGTPGQAKPRTTTIDLPRSMAARMQGHLGPMAAGSELSVKNSDGSAATVSYGEAEPSAASPGTGGLTPGVLQNMASANTTSNEPAATSGGTPRTVYGKPGSFR